MTVGTLSALQTRAHFILPATLPGKHYLLQSILQMRTLGAGKMHSLAEVAQLGKAAEYGL